MADMVTLTGTFQDGAGTPNTGRVMFTLAEAATDGTIIYTAAPVSAILDATGSISVELQATDDLTVDGDLYKVNERLNGVRSRTYYVELPGATDPADLADLATWDEPPNVVYSPTLGIAALDAALVAAQDINEIYRSGPSAVVELGAEAVGASFGIQVLGDSTGNETDEWVYLLAEYLADTYPACTVRHRLWNTAGNVFDAPTVIATGTGGDRHVTLDGGVGSFFYLADSAANSITGDIDIAVKAALADWTPSSAQVLAAKFGSGGTRAWRFWVSTDGKLNYGWSADGTNTSSVVSTVAPTVSNGQTLYVRVTHDVDNGASGHDVKFYTGSDGATWTQLGTTVTTATATSIFDAAFPVEIGTRSNGTESLVGDVYEVQIRNGILGPTVVPVPIEAWRPSSGTIVWSGAPVIDLVNASTVSASITYLNDATRHPKMTPDFNTLLTFFSCSHNDGGRLGVDYIAEWDTLLSLTRTRLPESTFVVSSQNPRTAPAANIEQHAARRARLSAWAHRNGLGYLDIYKAFVDDDQAMALLVDPSDGIHPLPAGAAVWAAAVETYITSRL